MTNILECERLQQALGDTQGLRFHASVPIWVGEQALGVMNLVGSERGLFSEEDARNLYAVGNQLGIALARARLSERLEQLVEERTAKLAKEVAERRKAEEEVRALNEGLEKRVAERTAELQSTNHELESFSYSVSHDLRAPLRHIDGYVAMLVEDTEGKLSAEAQHHLKVIVEASRHMGELIDDLLAFSRMGRAEMREVRVELHALAREAIRDLEMATRGRNIGWTIPPLHKVTGDRAMLKQVFANLLGNAVKYTRPRDPAQIEMGCAGEEDGRVILFVRDNGVGFDMKYADKLFGVFQRLHRADQFEGTGIGLANVRRIIARHGGRVWAEAVPDQGAAFYFTLKRVNS
jgi:light-regulated signal transduction histidine kinase (bacteriophytochrome)